MPDVFTEQFIKNNFVTVSSVLQIGGGQNAHEVVLTVSEMVIRESRAARVQPFNEYRKKFNQKPYASFYEFTGKQEKYCNNLLLKLFYNPQPPSPFFIFIFNSFARLTSNLLTSYYILDRQHWKKYIILSQNTDIPFCFVKAVATT